MNTLNPSAEEKLLSPVNLVGLGISIILHLGVLFLVVLPKNAPVVIEAEKEYDIVDLNKVPPPRPKPKPPEPKKVQPQKQQNRSGSAARKIFQSKSSTSGVVVKGNETKFDGDLAGGQGTGTGAFEGTGTGEGDPKAVAEAPPAPPPPPPPPAELIKAKAVSQPVAVYPDAARNEGREGTVIVRAYISETGEVTRTKVMRSSGHPDLDEAAQAAVSRMRFEPARRGDEKEASKVDIPIRFSLS